MIFHHLEPDVCNIVANSFRPLRGLLSLTRREIFKKNLWDQGNVPSTYYLKRLFLLSAKFMDDGVPSGNAVTTDESAINGCFENLPQKHKKLS